ncbi:MAG: glycoside hydrolase family 3 C-terminal domain-containing protein [Tannerella sp.]|jgi:beta-glucosidase|nr:glycoside hydrolase family 3 C-terminal domain-containing protein [Tannerella sp.]
MKIVYAFLLFFLLSVLRITAQTYPFQNPDLPVEQRVNDLVGRMTPEEKVSQMMDGAPAIERLGIPAYNWWNECLHGVARAGIATMFPQAIGLAATFDTDAVYRTATVISDEARAKYHHAIAAGDHSQYHGLTFWTPNINIFRDPRWGRGQETYGEDPFLTGETGVAFVKGLQGDDPNYLKLVATAKHYAVHSGPEYSRHTYDARPPLRDVWDTYLPAFEKLVRTGEAYSVMCAYNRFEGEPCCGSDELMEEILRKRWGFQGYVVSDCGAIDNFYRTHKTSPDAAAASANAVIAGTDIECGSSYKALIEAVKRGEIKEEEIDVAVKRLFTARMKLGMFDPDSRVPYSKIPYSTVGSARSREQSLEMARKSIVLLKNENQTLPLDKNIKTIAVIGPNADNPTCLLANYNGSPLYIVTPLEGIRRKVGKNTKVIYHQGISLTSDSVSIPDDLGAALKAGGKIGFKAEYFNNNRLEGESAWTQYEKAIDFFGASQHKTLTHLKSGKVSARWTSVLTPEKDGQVFFEITSDDSGFRLFVDDKTVIDRFSYQEARVEYVRLEVKAGQKYALRFEFTQGYEGGGVSLSPVRREKADARALAETVKKADAIVFVGGISPSLEGEEMPVSVPGFNKGDRTSIALPTGQTETLKALKETGKPVIFVMLTGSALAIKWENDHLPAILNAWYGGQDAGTALADVLFGDYNPAGRLPVTFYASDADLPPYEDYSMRERTYRYFTGKPLYEFGYGLSYTQFAYSDLQTPETVPVGEPVTVSVTVTNQGARDGDEVVQLYLSHVHAYVPVPLRSLQGIRRIRLKAGESCKVEFTLSPEQFSLIDALMQRSIEPGEIQIGVGGCQPTGEAVNQGKALRKTVVLTGKKVVADPAVQSLPSILQSHKDKASFTKLNGGTAANILPLFNGKDLTGWYTYTKTYGKNNDVEKAFVVDNGVLHFAGEQMGYICTKDAYKNYYLRVVFRWGDKKYAPRLNNPRDSGVLYHFPESAEDKLWPASIECQIQENDCGDYWCVGGTNADSPNASRMEGTQKRIVRTANYENPLQEWNTVEIVCIDDHSEHYVNGHLVNQAGHLSVSEGKILFQLEGSEICYKSIELISLK